MLQYLFHMCDSWFVLKSLLTYFPHMVSSNLYRTGGLETLGLIEQFCSLVLPHLYLTTVLPKHKYGFPVGNFIVDYIYEVRLA